MGTSMGIRLVPLRSTKFVRNSETTGQQALMESFTHSAIAHARGTGDRVGWGALGSYGEPHSFSYCHDCPCNRYRGLVESPIPCKGYPGVVPSSIVESHFTLLISSGVKFIACIII